MLQNEEHSKGSPRSDGLELQLQRFALSVAHESFSRSSMTCCRTLPGLSFSADGAELFFIHDAGIVSSFVNVRDLVSFLQAFGPCFTMSQESEYQAFFDLLDFNMR
ncbi:hypothetical protein MRB53_040652 [Persea americana]|nr:hypothetical protein MRB53_040652 [Persea americana]